MNHSNRKIYSISAAVSSGILGYGFIIINRPLQSPAVGCFFNQTFKFPCIACGGSHAIQSLYKLNMIDSLWYNSFVSILFLVSVIIFILIMVDLLFNKNYYLKLYKRIYGLLQMKKITWGLIIVLVLFWAINIYHYPSYF